MPTNSMIPPRVALAVSPRRAACLSFLTVLLCSTLLAACGKGSDFKGPSAGGAPPPAEVGVVIVAPGDVGLVTELPGRLEASRIAQVRARAAGILQKRLFREGSDVKAGQPLPAFALRLHWHIPACSLH